MKASYNWLKEFTGFKLNPQDLAHAMTMAGFEVEGISIQESDTVFDVNITPNRPDCLSIVGLAREISAILQVPLNQPSYNIKKQEGRAPDVVVKDEGLCRRYSARMISGVKAAPSPEWLKRRLESHGLRTSFNIVDITNYVLVEMGQPLHAFDLDRLSGKKVSVRTAGTIDSFETLDGEKRSLKSDMLMIWDAERPVAVAGVMGGLDTEVTSTTTNILLESACFEPTTVRRTSKSLGLVTESSYRFERGIDINKVIHALDRAALMIQEIAGGTISELTDIYPQSFKPVTLFISYNRITSLLGIRIDQDRIHNILSSLGFILNREGEGMFVTPPEFRHDIQREVDIIEEVARLYGYDKIPATLPTIRMCPSPVNKRERLIDIINKSMGKAGFSEVINYSFMTPDSLDRLNIPGQDRRRKYISIKNPLRKEESVMRTTIIPSLIRNLILNFNRGEKTIRFYEISRVFFDSGLKLPQESLNMAAIFNKNDSLSLYSDRHEGFYDLKGVFENLINDLKVNSMSFKLVAQNIEPYLHPGKSCSIHILDKKIGSLGTLHPSILEIFDIKGDISILELNDLQMIMELTDRQVSFHQLPKYPFILRDIAIIVDRDISIQQISDEIKSIDSDIVESVNLFDIYTGKPVPPDKKSLAFSIQYRSQVRTLTDEEVNVLHASILNKLKETFRAELR